MLLCNGRVQVFKMYSIDTVQLCRISRRQASHRISPSLVTSRIGSLGSSKHIFKMASRREETRREEGYYGRLHRFSTADEWNVLRPPSVVRKRKSEVFEVEFFLGERKRKVREFPLFVFAQ